MDGEIFFNEDRLNGAKLNRIGWKHSKNIDDAISSLSEWYVENDQ